MPTDSLTALSIVKDLGMAGLFILLFKMWWTERKDQMQREKEDRIEREKLSKEDRLLLTNHLSEIFRKEVESREGQAIALTKLSESIANFQKNCLEIQSNLRTQVDRMQRGNDDK